ncbi:MAG: hypothetical protein ACC645_08665 [Pirellulales bacterium]
MAITPHSPEVVELIEKGLRYVATTQDARLGAKCLAGMAFLKTGHDTSHPVVSAAVEACRQAAMAGPRALREDIYSTGIATIFLCDLETQHGDYQAEINVFLDSLRQRQKGHGGWGYPERSTGDTSMTQYGVLSAWEADRAGYGLSVDSIVRVCNWLTRTQDPSGGWGYQGSDPGSYELTEQSMVTPSLTAAGLGSLYICADLLKMGKPDRAKTERHLPPALKLVESPTRRMARLIGGRVERRRLWAAIDRGNVWFEKNYVIKLPQWTYYYLYALERYQTMRDASQRSQATLGTWYQDGFRFLAMKRPSGVGWVERCGGMSDSSFAILFLSRSMKQSLGRRYGDGRLTGGRGLPRDIAHARLQNGQVVGTGLDREAVELIRLLSDPRDPDYAFLVDHPEELVNEANRRLLASQSAQFQRLLSRGPPDARCVAVRALAAERDLGHVPVLIRALSDRDWRVVREANDALQRISRRFDVVELPYQKENIARQRAIDDWTGWYRTVRPGADVNN